MKLFYFLFSLTFAFSNSTQAQYDSTTIAIIGCHEQHKPAPVIPYFANKVKPEFTIWVGDNVYADTKGDAQYIQRQLEVLGNKDGFLELKQVSKFMITWDDHDYGLNNAGINYPLKNESLEIHRKFWELESDVPANQDGIYHAKIEKLANGKTIQFIMLDIRYNKSKSDILGENQWSWLNEQLKAKADLRFIISGTQVLLNRPTRWEAWTRNGQSKKRLLNLIKINQTKGVVFITGDQHYNEVLKGKEKMGYAAFEFMAAGINKTEKPGWAGKRVAGPDVTVHSAPTITIYWSDKDDSYLHLKVVDVTTNQITLSYKILFSKIGL